MEVETVKNVFISFFDRPVYLQVKLLIYLYNLSNLQVKMFDQHVLPVSSTGKTKTSTHTDLLSFIYNMNQRYTNLTIGLCLLLLQL